MGRVAALLAVVALLAVPAAAPAKKPVVVRVTGIEFAYKLSRAQVPVGPVRFVFTNRGSHPHDFAIAGRKTPIIGRGRTASLTVVFKKAGRYRFLCTVPGHAKLGMRGFLRVGKAKPQPKPEPEPEPPASQSLKLTRVAAANRPVAVAAAPGDARRLYVVEQGGVIRELLDGVVREQPFLDITALVGTANEAGLLGLAFAPDYATSGLLYVVFNDRNGSKDYNLVEFRRSPVNQEVADGGSYRQVLQIVKPWEDHNAGTIQFGPDGYLYVAVGDGDSGVVNPPGRFAQTLDDLLGNILRIDPRQDGAAPYAVPGSNPFVGRAGVRPEIVAYGLRNPWRFWVEPDGGIYIGDVALGEPEEIDYMPPGSLGVNLGWPCRQGTDAFDTSATCPDAVDPVLEYRHTKGECSVIAGLVAHDPRLPSLEGRFLYGDLCTGELRSFKLVDGKATEDESLGLTVTLLTSFGVGADGRIYATSIQDGGALYRLDPA